MLRRVLHLKSRPVCLISVVSKTFKKLLNNRLADHLVKFGLFSNFQYGFRCSRSTADLLTVESDRIAKLVNRFGDSSAEAVDVFKAFDWI